MRLARLTGRVVRRARSRLRRAFAVRAMSRGRGGPRLVRASKNVTFRLRRPRRRRVNMSRVHNTRANRGYFRAGLRRRNTRIRRMMHARASRRYLNSSF